MGQSAVSGNSNFYLYNSNTTTSGPANSGQVRYNNVETKIGDNGLYFTSRKGQY